jgi:Integrase core domain
LPGGVGVQWELPGAVGAQWELPGVLARRDQGVRSGLHPRPPELLQGETFGAVGKKGSIALIERLWRTLKDTLGLRLMGPLVAEDLAAKIEVGLVPYAHFRPHQALGGATPAEMYFGRTPAHLSAIPPPRGRPGEGSMDSPLRVEYLDVERILPFLVRKAA